MLVQLFFAWRVNTVSDGKLAALFICVCSLCQWFGGLGTSIALTKVHEFTEFRRFQVPVAIWLVSSVLADMTITIILVKFLHQHKTGFPSIDDVVDKIIRLTVQTGLITTLCAIVDLIVFLSVPSAFHLVFNLPLSKLYSNSLLSNLNSRTGWHLEGGNAEVHERRGGGQQGGVVTFEAAPNPSVIRVERHEMTSWTSTTPQLTTIVDASPEFKSPKILLPTAPNDGERDFRYETA
ncbi:hypothetical protein OBBRIDRAFT_88138 [Obba rivulosa]|uniref:DUF6534 domain-containing protein n=1 Tax=Obba rivulosa TaxID=1052685 RepID=A0A8E2APE2_9APHY|nr:hypothetical protein OBBRIDRAFT_88138 [Obba rivulosa]